MISQKLLLRGIYCLLFGVVVNASWKVNLLSSADGSIPGVAMSSSAVAAECGDEVSACINSASCSQCWEDVVGDDDGTDDDGTDGTGDDDIRDIPCDDLNEGICQLFGASATCSANDVYVAFVECFFEAHTDCTVELCGGDDGTVDDSNAFCSSSFSQAGCPAGFTYNFYGGACDGACTADDCCVLGGKTCADYTGGCNSQYENPVPDGTVCGFTCFESNCCAILTGTRCHLHFSRASCLGDTTFDYGGDCGDICTVSECCPDSTCDNTFDGTCASSEGPALGSTRCSTGANGCDADLCCVPNETCADYTGTCTSPDILAPDDEVCVGACDESTCCVPRDNCYSDFSSTGCPAGTAYNLGASCDGNCDETDCCETDSDGAVGCFGGASTFAVVGGAASIAVAALTGLPLS